MIKNCDNEAYEEELCAQHYIEILKKVITEKKTGKKIFKSDSPGEDMSTKTQFMMHSLLVHVDKFTDSVVSSFNNIFNLTKDESVEIYRNMSNKYFNKQNNQKAIPLLKKVIELNPNDAESRYQLGSIYFAQEDYDGANACFDEAIQLNPDNSDYHFAIGLGYEQKELFDEAITSLQKAAELNPENSDAYYRL
ncbi:MAG: tetratricopeptide repeat protein, partial [Candidatus Neomarinimicrobiota bacterium]